MTHSRLRPATEDDARFMAARLRPSDVYELEAASGMTPSEALFGGMALSKPHAWVLDDPATGEPFAMGGVRPARDHIGIVWLLATDAVKGHWLTLHREVRRMLRSIRLFDGYAALSNVVCAENAVSVRWLDRLGFRIVHRDQPLRHGVRFHSFAIGRGSHV